MLSKRNIPINILLTFITCGLYGLYWQAKVNDEVHGLSGAPQTTTGGKAALYSFITCSLYYMFWVYKVGGELADYRTKKGWQPDAVPPAVYTWTAVVLTFVAAAFSCLDFVLNLASEMDDIDVNSEQFAGYLVGIAVVSLGYMVVIFIIQCVLTAIVIWVNYKRSDKSPQALYVVMALLRTNIFTTAFLQASLNDTLDRLEQEGGL